MNNMEAVSFPKGKPKARQMHPQILPKFQSFKPLLMLLHSIQRKRTPPNTLKSGITLTPKQGKDTATTGTT